MVFYKIQFQSFLKLIKTALLIQVFNAAMAYFIWVATESIVPSWMIAVLSVFCTIMILAMKTAQEREAKLP